MSLSRKDAELYFRATADTTLPTTTLCLGWEAGLFLRMLCSGHQRAEQGPVPACAFTHKWGLGQVWGDCGLLTQWNSCVQQCSTIQRASLNAACN